MILGCHPLRARMFFAIVVGLDELPDALVAMGIGVEDGRHNTGRRHLCVCTLGICTLLC